jgi:hypothetical protein
MLKDLELPIMSMFAIYVVVSMNLTKDNYNLVFYSSIDEQRCSSVEKEINSAHRRIRDDFRVEKMSLRFYLELVFKKGFAIGRNTTEEI